MQTFKLIYGDYLWPELFTRLVTAPFVIISGQELTISQAIRKNIVKKTSKIGDYSTSAEAIRILVITENNTERYLANLVMKFTEPKGSMVHATLYPKEVSQICSESGYFFAADNMHVVSKMEEIKQLYNPGYLKMVETLNENSLISGKNLCKLLNNTITTNRFRR